MIVIDGLIEIDVAGIELREIASKQQQYEQLVLEKIRVNYSQDDEFARMALGIADSTDALYVAYR